MARKGKRSEDSLDLLLDTICNTFGGILFISMLVVILLTMSSESVPVEPPSPAAHGRMVDLRDQLERTQAALNSLQSAVKQRETLRDRFTSRESVDLARQLQELTGRAETAVALKNEGLEAIASAQKDINETLSKMQQFRQEQERLQAALLDIQSRLDAEIAVRSRTSQLPKQRRTTKTQIPFLIKDGRLHAYASVDPSGRVVHNERDVKVLMDGEKSYLEPISGAGLVLNPASEDLSGVETSFAPFDKERYFVALVVWPDSFEHCQLAKTALVRGGFEYQLIPWSGERRLYIGLTTEQGGVVQ